MCGIVGLIAFDASAERAHGIVSAMAERIRHRGPDGGGVVAHPDATLGMTRLAIVDVVHGHQPMANEDESIVIVYNGEIYNAPALRAELEKKGVRFKTRSDTEVILRLYEHNPERVEEELAGMWAFVIHDRKRRRVVLSRDRFGIKPFYVVDTGTAVAFASELQCFDKSLAPFRDRFAVDHAAAHAMLSWSYIPENGTIYQGVKRLPLASRMEIDLATGARRSRVYWHLTLSPEAARVTSLDEACSGVEALLRRSVREHLESDVPIATFLSGGIDSSLVTALAAEESSKQVKAYTIGFTEPRFDESPFARETAEKIGVPIQIEKLDEATALARLPEALLAYDEPFADSSSLAVNLLCAHVGRDYKVALGGDGGDEVFAGYKKYLIMKLRKPFAAVPEVRDAMGRALGKIPTRTDRTRGWTELLRTVRKLSRGLAGNDAEIYAQLTQIAPLSRTAELVREPGTSASRLVDALRERFEAGDGTEVQRTLACDLSNTLPNDMLVKIDRASMAHHLEARVPFLDHRLVEYGVGLPERFTLGMNGKVVLRELHERRFGRKLARRKKMGFGTPVEKWLRGPLEKACARMFEERRLDSFGVLSTEALSGGRHRELLARDPQLLWHVFSLAAWCEANLGGGPDAVRELLATSVS
jgi:asparagine synthase (glutamine-hydrolysing)